MPEDNGNTIRELEKVIHREFTNASKKYVTWFGLTMTLIVVIGVAYLWLNSRFNKSDETFNAGFNGLDSSITQISKQMGFVANEMSSNLIFFNGLYSAGTVNKFVAGKQLTAKGEALLKSELELMNAINAVYAKNPNTLPGSAPRYVFEYLEKKGIDPAIIAKRQKVDAISLTTVVMAKAYAKYEKSRLLSGK